MIIIAGDLNSNSIWDEEGGHGDHSAVVNLLGQHHLVSAYHCFFSERQGEEARPTLYFWHRQERGYHTDLYSFRNIGRHE
jgi:hypothetical protein